MEDIKFETGSLVCLVIEAAVMILLPIIVMIVRCY